MVKINQLTEVLPNVMAFFRKKRGENFYPWLVIAIFYGILALMLLLYPDAFN